MRHRKGYKKIGRRCDARASMMDNLVTSMLKSGYIVTTAVKAKALRPYLERIITKARNGKDRLDIRRAVSARIFSEDAVKNLFSDVVTKFADRQGGYTKITKLGYRYSDSSLMAKIEFVA